MPTHNGPTAPLQDRLSKQNPFPGSRDRHFQSHLPRRLVVLVPDPGRPAVPGALSKVRPQLVNVGRQVLAAARAALRGRASPATAPGPGPV